MRAVDVVQGTRFQLGGDDGIRDALGKVRAEADRLHHLGQELVEEPHARAVIERGKRARDVRLAGADRGLAVHGRSMLARPSITGGDTRSGRKPRIARCRRHVSRTTCGVIRSSPSSRFVVADGNRR